MSLINIGKVIDAGDDLKKLVDACKSFETADDVARALSKFSTASKRLKASALTEALEHMDYDSASKLLDVTDDIVNIGDAAVEASKKTSKLESGFKALGTAVYTIYKNYKQNLIDTATTATEAWDNSLSDIQSKIQQFQELKTKLDSGDLSQSETIEVKLQILDLQNQIVATYGDQILSRCMNEPTIPELKIKNRSSSFNYPGCFTHATPVSGKIPQLLPVKIEE